jgi:hypothetical protein
MPISRSEGKKGTSYMVATRVHGIKFTATFGSEEEAKKLDAALKKLQKQAQEAPDEEHKQALLRRALELAPPKSKRKHDAMKGTPDVGRQQLLEWITKRGSTKSIEQLAAMPIKDVMAELNCTEGMWSEQQAAAAAGKTLFQYRNGRLAANAGIKVSQVGEYMRGVLGRRQQRLDAQRMQLADPRAWARLAEEFRTWDPLPDNRAAGSGGGAAPDGVA